MLNKEEIETCKKEIKNYIEFMETAGDNAGWARGILWYIEQLETKVKKYELETIPKQVIKDLNKEYLEKIKEYQERNKGDEEARHIAEDDLLCELLTKIGFDEVVKQYIKTSKWYA